MLTPVCLLPDAIADLFAQVSCSGKITLADRYGLMAALLDDSLTCQDRELLDRLLRASYRGRLKVVDEISAVFNAKTPELERKIEALILSSCAWLKLCSWKVEEWKVEGWKVEGQPSSLLSEKLEINNKQINK